MAAFKANKFVCEAISAITLQISPILTIDWFNNSIVLLDAWTASTTRVVASILWLIFWLDLLTNSCDSLAATAASEALAATSCTDWLNSSVAAATLSTLLCWAKDCSATWFICSSNSPLRLLMEVEASATLPIIQTKRFCIFVKVHINSPSSSREVISIFSLKFAEAICSQLCIAACNGRLIAATNLAPAINAARQPKIKAPMAIVRNWL